MSEGEDRAEGRRGFLVMEDGESEDCMANYSNVSEKFGNYGTTIALLRFRRNFRVF